MERAPESCGGTIQKIHPNQRLVRSYFNRCFCQAVLPAGSSGSDNVEEVCAGACQMPA